MHSTLSNTNAVVRTLTRRLDLDSLRLLALACRERSYASASRHDCLTSSAIAKRIRELERLSGGRLVLKSGSELSPTEMGARLLDCWQAISQQLVPLAALRADAQPHPNAAFTEVLADDTASKLLKAHAAAHEPERRHAWRLKVSTTRIERLPAALCHPRTVMAVWAADSPARHMLFTHAVPDAPFRKHTLSAQTWVAVMRREHRVLEQALLTQERLAELQGAGRVECPPLPAQGQPQGIENMLDDLRRTASAKVLLLPAAVLSRLHRHAALAFVPLQGALGRAPFVCLVRDDSRHDAHLARLLEVLHGTLLPGPTG